MHVDSHQHFWRYSSEQYPWISDAMAPLRRDFLPDDLAPLLDQHQLGGSVAVQARQSIEESQWLLELAESSSRVLGVVGWVDLRGPDLDAQLDALAPHAKFVGVRHVAQDEPDDQFLAREEFVAGVAKLRARELTYDILIFPRQLDAAITLVRALPDQPFVLDHLAKPDFQAGVGEGWRSKIAALAELPNVCCKVSGMVTEADWANWRPEDFREGMQVVLDHFGPDRLMYGSDWPVCLAAASYDAMFDIPRSFFASLSQAEQAAVFGGTARGFYGLPSPSPNDG